jgi:CheY-like chemotaxis protein
MFLASQYTNRRAERILLVDDNEALCKLLQTTLELEGYRVLAATDPLEALAIAEREPELALLLTDVDMPHLTGPELAARVRSLAPRTRVVFMSGRATGPHLDFPGGASFLPKPFTLAELVTKVAETLAAPPSTSAD